MSLRKLFFLPVASVLCLSAAAITAQAQNATLHEAASVTQHPTPYHEPGTAPDPTVYLPPPPETGSLRQQSDDKAFATTRSLKGSARWALAQTDADLHLPVLLNSFSCSAGFVIDADKTPHLLALVHKILKSEKGDIRQGKAYWHRVRPFVGTSHPTCTEEDRQKIARTGAYPSGHTVLGWSTALVLAELLPDRSTTLLQRGRIFGESRIVCGVHWASDVQEGYLMGAGEIAAMHGNAQFRADMEAARAELTTLRGTAPQPNPQTCAIEQDAAAHSPL